MADDLDYLSNLFSADIASDNASQPSSNQDISTLGTDKVAGKRKLTEDDTFIKELEENVKAKKKKIEGVQAKRCEELIKKHFGDLSDDEEDEFAIFSSTDKKDSSSNLYSMGLNNKTTWKTKVDSSKPAATLHQGEKFDVYAEPVFGMRLINPCLSMQDLKYKMTGRQPISMSRIKQHVASPDVDAIDWVVGGVLVGKSPPKTSQKGSQYCIWTLSDLKSGLQTVSVFLFSSAFTSLWKTNVGVVLGVLNPSVMDNSRSTDEACLSVNNGDKIMVWGTSKDYGKCKARKKDGENCTNFVNVHECQYCVYHVKQEYKKFTGRSEFQSQGGGALTNLRNKVLGNNEVFYGGQSFTALKPAKKSSKLAARDNKLLQSLSKSGVMVSPLASINTSSSRAQTNSQTRGKKIEDAERMRRLTGEPVYVSSHKMAGDQEWNTNMTFKNILQKDSIPSPSLPKAHSSSLVQNTSSNTGNKSKPTKKDDLFDFDSNIELGSKKNSAGKNNLNGTSSSPKLSGSKVLDSSAKPSTSKVPTSYQKSLKSSSKPDLQRPKSSNQAQSLKPSSKPGSTASQDQSSQDASSIKGDSRSVKLGGPTLRTSSEIPPSSSPSQLSQDNSDSSQPSQAAANIANYFAKKSEPPVATTQRILLSKDLRERKKQITRAKAESLIKHKGGIEKANPNSLKKNISNVVNKSADLELEIEGDKKDLAFKEMMQKTSRHMDLVDEAHRREEEDYFAKLEKKEEMEEKMLNTFKVECKAVRCVECKYTWFSASELCKRERHTIKLIQTFKRFFKCVNCSTRTISFDVVPLRACSHCGVISWARAPMMQEKKVDLESGLSIRGGESKYLNSMSSGGAASLNLLVPE